MEKDTYFMKECMSLAELGQGSVSPNPMVGAVIVKGDTIVGKGYHKRAGSEHAEIEAMRNAGNDCKGATLYINLEPCAHWGRTPPCVDKIMESGIAKVVVAIKDPNPCVSGRGIEKLKRAGIDVITGVMEEEAKVLNEVFIKYITTGRPFVVLKYAMTMDGKIASNSGDSKWITGPDSRAYVHQLRSIYDAIAVGIGTVLIDNPRLTVRNIGTDIEQINNKRINNKRDKMDSDKQGIIERDNPIRIVIDSTLKTPLDAKVLTEDGKVIIATTKRASKKKGAALKEYGAGIIYIDGCEGQVDIDCLLLELGKEDITSVLLEGGGEINASFIDSGNVDKIICFIAPIIAGGKGAKTPVEGKGIQVMSRSKKIFNAKMDRIGEDFIIEGYVKGR